MHRTEQEADRSLRMAVEATEEAGRNSAEDSGRTLAVGHKPVAGRTLVEEERSLQLAALPVELQERVQEPQERARSA